jgi:hypothetical protein
MQEQRDENLEDMRQRALNLFSQDWEVLLHLLNGFLFWRGMLKNDEQTFLHNAAEAYVMFLMGPPFPPKNLDPRYLEQLETLMGEVSPLARMSGASETPHNKKRRRKA